jgi:hypothetical protein
MTAISRSFLLVLPTRLYTNRFGLVCRAKKYASYAATSSTKSAKSVDDYDSGEDTGPLITSDPTPLNEIGKGQANFVKYVIPRPVDIGHQRALEVGTLNGSFTTQYVGGL